MNFDNPCWIDLKVTYEYYQAAGRLPEFHKKYVCTKCQYDYNEMVTKIEAGVLVKRVPLYAGELYGTDQYKAADAQDTNIGKLLEVNTDGKWQVATTGTSRFEFAGVMDDNGHKLIMISVLPDAKTVA